MALGYRENRVVRFFCVIDHTTGQTFDDDLPWDHMLETIESWSPDDRTSRLNGEDHHGGPWMGTPNMLLLSKIRAGNELPELFDRRSGSLDSLQLAEEQGIAETTHVAFFERNIVAMIRKNTTPGAAQLASWIRDRAVFEGLGPVDIVPLSRVSIEEKVKDIERAKGVQIRARSAAADYLRKGGSGRLADTIDQITQTFGPVTVEMRIYVRPGEPANDVRETILAEAQGLVRLLAGGEAVEGIEAAKLQYDSLAQEKAAELNFLKDKFAETVVVEVMDADGRSTRRSSAAAAMKRAFDHLRADLLRSVESHGS